MTIPKILSFALAAAAAVAQQSGTGYRVVGPVISGASQVQAAAGQNESKLTFESSDARLVEAFTWAKRQSMAFAFDDDPVGPWYEAAEPGREAFCMRDVAHQAMGAHALGLARPTHNMLRRFAENIAESRDWCSFWEMDRYNRPAPTDYKNDAEFWYCLPANYDILDCCWRMYVWTGDLTYINDPVFLNFYDRTVADYEDRWSLGLDRVMKRKRFMNVRGEFDPAKGFQFYRGNPSYQEAHEEFVLGADLLATQYAGYLAYAGIQDVRRNDEGARAYLKRAADVKALLNNTWWNEKEQSFYGRLDKDHQLQGRGGGALLNRDAVDDGPKLAAVLKDGGGTEVLYRYGDPDAAYARMLDAAFSTRSRREYPEVPYSWIGSLVNGTMGITLETASFTLSERANFIDRFVRTLAGLGTKIAWAEIRNLPIRKNEVTVRHEGTRKTVLTNQRGPALVWKATFAGSFETLLVNGQPMKARVEKGLLGKETSWVRIAVGGGGAVTVEVPELSKPSLN